MAIRLLSVVVLLVLFASTASAQQIYKWKDGKGQWHFSNTPPSDVETNKVRFSASLQPKKTKRKLGIKGSSERVNVTGANSPALKIDRVWSEHGYGYALVTYTNNSGATLRRVMVQCVALGKNDKKLNANDWVFFSHEDGSIPPGTSDTQRVKVPLHGADMKSMSCKPKVKR